MVSGKSIKLDAFFGKGEWEERTQRMYIVAYLVKQFC